jgi:hypothetical protein
MQTSSMPLPALFLCITYAEAKLDEPPSRETAKETFS